MFLFFFIKSKQADVPFHQPPIIHDHCGKFGQMQLFQISEVFYLFFIPLFKFNKRYFVRMSCCGEVYQMDKDLVKQIKKGKKTNIQLKELIDLNDYHRLGKLPCPSCGYILESSSRFCSQCGTFLEN